MRRQILIVGLAFSALIISAGLAEENTYSQEGDRLALALNWHDGSVVADIGAGRGELTLIAARQVGATGRVYATELDPQKLALLKTLAEKGTNIFPIQAGVSQTNLPPDCCDSIFMRLVYHHFTKPAEIDASLFRSLKPGGLLAVIDTEPPPGTKRVEGVPENRIGHGVPQKVLIDELMEAGFKVVSASTNWPPRNAFHPIYIVIFRKPSL
jgi:ubiquinone/menaquinone biosynthesis C-methylase UbiE